MTVVKQQRKLRLRFKKVIGEAISAPMKVVIIYDSSSSISATDFAEEKKCGRRIISSFPPRTKIAALHFSSTVGLIAGFDASRDELLAENDRTIQFSQDTATFMALDMARELFRVSKSADEEERHLVILLTDGCPQDQAAAEMSAQNLRREGCELIGIGLGALNEENLIRVVGRENFFLIDSWVALTAALDLTPNSTRLIVPESEVSIEALQLQVPVRLDEAIPLTLTISNTGIAPITPGAILKLSDPNHYYKNELRVITEQVGIGGSINVTISLAPHGRPKAEDLPEVVEWTLQDPVSRKFYYVTSEGFEVQIHNMFGEFLSWKPSSHVRDVANICLFGPAGSGKSRMNNSLASIFTETQSRVAEELGYADHTTKEITAYRVADCINTDDGSGGPDLKFQFYDTFGLGRETYQKPNEFEALVDGALPMGWSRKDTRPVPTTGPISNRKDAIIFVLHQGAVLDEEVMKLTRQFVERAVRDRRMAPIAVITHADELEPEDWEPIRLKAKEGLGLSQVFILDNSEEKAKTFTRDKTLYLILRSALQSAQERIKAEDARDMNRMLPK